MGLVQREDTVLLLVLIGRLFRPVEIYLVMLVEIRC